MVVHILLGQGRVRGRPRKEIKNMIRLLCIALVMGVSSFAGAQNYRPETFSDNTGTFSTAVNTHTPVAIFTRDGKPGLVTLTNTQAQSSVYLTSYTYTLANSTYSYYSNHYELKADKSIDLFMGANAYWYAVSSAVVTTRIQGVRQPK